MPGAKFGRRARAVGAALAAGAAMMAAAPAVAQSASCMDIQKTLIERKDIVAKLGGKSKLQPKDACQMFTRLVANGTTALKWIEANKDWCQVPDAFAEGIKGDHAKAVQIRGRACNAAAQQAAMEKRAREAGGGEGGGLLGGGGLSGTMRLPQGAL